MFNEPDTLTQSFETPTSPSVPRPRRTRRDEQLRAAYQHAMARDAAARRGRRRVGLAGVMLLTVGVACAIAGYAAHHDALYITGWGGLVTGLLVGARGMSSTS